MTNQQPIKLVMPILKAKPIAHGFDYEGNRLTVDVDPIYRIMYPIHLGNQIKSEKLQISIDGENFYTIEFVKEAIEFNKQHSCEKHISEHSIRYSVGCNEEGEEYTEYNYTCPECLKQYDFFTWYEPDTINNAVEEVIEHVRGTE